MTTDLVIACVSDIHLGHKRTSTQHIVDNLNTYLTNDKVFSTLDILFLAGDVFDDLISMQADASRIATLWMHKIALLALKHDVTVRILEGTPSHDREQSEHFLSSAAKALSATGQTPKLRYIKTLSIEYIEEYAIHVLYVPDEWRHDNAQTLIEVDELLAAKNLTQVDFAVMHGMFEHQAPSVLRRSLVHDSAEYLKRVKYLTFIGHDHHASQNDRIYAQGSFDRLAHGEEADKGYLLTKVQRSGTSQVTFVKNKGAMIYKTVVSYGLDAEVEYVKIAKVAEKVPDGSYVRIETKRGLPAAMSLSTFKTRYPLIHWSLLIKQDKESPDSPTTIAPITYTPLLLNKGTLVELARARVSNGQHDGQVISRMCALIEDCL
jgi:hypothetical protein